MGLIRGKAPGDFTCFISFASHTYAVKQSQEQDRSPTWEDFRAKALWRNQHGWIGADDLRESIKQMAEDISVNYTAQTESFCTA